MGSEMCIRDRYRGDYDLSEDELVDFHRPRMAALVAAGADLLACETLPCLAEARALEAALGQTIADVPVWPTKSMLSNTGAASGALDVIAAICAIRDGSIPAAKNCDNKAPGCNLNIVTEPQQRRIKYALVCSYTYGGQTAAVVLKNPDKQMSE